MPYTFNRYLIRIHFIIMLCLYTRFIPESLRWLYAKGYTKEAQKMTLKLAKASGTLHELPEELNIKIEVRQYSFHMAVGTGDGAAGGGAIQRV